MSLPHFLMKVTKKQGSILATSAITMPFSIATHWKKELDFNTFRHQVYVHVEIVEWHPIRGYRRFSSSRNNFWGKDWRLTRRTGLQCPLWSIPNMLCWFDVRILWRPVGSSTAYMLIRVFGGHALCSGAETRWSRKELSPKSVPKEFKAQNCLIYQCFATMPH